MSTLSELLSEHTRLPTDAVEHLQRVVAEWQLLADMSFADFLLWVPLCAPAERGAVPDAATATEWLCVAQARPTTAPTAYPRDVVAARVAAAENPQLQRAVVERRICREEDPRWHLEVPVRRETIPVRRGATVLAALSRDTNLAMPRVPSPMEIAYLGSASDLCQMIADGTFPPSSSAAGADTSPRAGDGLIRLDAHGQVAYASPNALSAYHRMGHASDLVGLPLAATTRSLIRDAFDAAEVAERINVALEGRHSLRMEVQARGAVMLVRALPLRPRGTNAGALVLVRDITDLRRRDLALLSKDATIREIHHRVKNNLQTVAALLRLQARRTAIPEAQRALAESVRRINSIALVHESLSGSVSELVDLDELVDTVLPAVGDGATAETRAKVRREAASGSCRPPSRPRSYWCSPSWCTTRWPTPSNRGRPVRCACAPSGRAVRWTWWWPTTASACRPASIWSSRTASGCRSCGRCSARSWTPRCRCGRVTAVVRRPSSGSRCEGVNLLPVAPDTAPRSRRRGGRAIPRSPDRVGRRPRARCRVVSGCRARGGGVSGRRCRSALRRCVLCRCSADRQAVCARVRALRRLRARRSSSLIPPQTPASWPLSSAQARHSLTTGQRRQTDFASAICSRAGPLVPTGKNSSGSSSRQIAR